MVHAPVQGIETTPMFQRRILTKRIPLQSWLKLESLPDRELVQSNMMSCLPDSDDGMPESDDGDSDLSDAPAPFKKPAACGKRTLARRPPKLKLDRPAGRIGQPLKSLLLVLIAEMTIDFTWPAETTSAAPASTLPMFWEIYSPPRVSLLLDPDKTTHKSFDTLTGWNLAVHWDLLLSTYVRALPRPVVILACPPCTMFSTLAHSNWWRMPIDKREAALKEGFFHLLLVTFLLAYHVKNGGYYLFEHPDRASSWKVPALVELPGEIRVIDQCMTGLKSPDGVPLKKRTKIKTNIPWLLAELSLPKYQCDGSHAHTTISSYVKGVKMSTWSQVYPRELCLIFAKAVESITLSHQ